MADFAGQNPFALLTLIVAPAMLTNASTVLALSTSNRFLRTGERLHVLAAELETTTIPEERAWRLVHVNRIEQQARLLLSALRAVYISLAAFMSATLITIVGAGLASLDLPRANHVMIVLALLVGFIGAAAIISSSINLLRSTRLSMTNLSENAAVLRQREECRRTSLVPQPASAQQPTRAVEPRDAPE